MTILAALVVGLLQGSLHCSGMCGPFVLAFGLALPGRGPGTAVPLFVSHLAHNAGRLTAFAALGLVFGLVGGFVDAAARLTGLQAVAGLIGGGLMLLWAIDQARSGHGGAGLERWSLWRIGPLRRWLPQLYGRRDAAGAYACGLVVGLHPCGLLYALLLAAAASGSAGRGALILLAFGLGTVPALLAVGAAGTWGAVRVRGRVFSTISAVVVGLGGVLFCLRGLAVNGLVPHVWPWLF